MVVFQPVFFVVVVVGHAGLVFEPAVFVVVEQPELIPLSLTVTASVRSDPVLHVELETSVPPRLLSEARVGSLWPEPSCFEAPGCSEVFSLQSV